MPFLNAFEFSGLVTGGSEAYAILMLFGEKKNSAFVKICGLTRRANVVDCLAAEADAIGLNFYPKSKRFITLEKARDILHEIPNSLMRVALFVNAPRETIAIAIDSGLFHAVQLHGDETLEFCSDIRLLGLPVIRAFALRTAADLDLLKDHPADGFILDAFAPDYGGSGHTCDWPLAALAIQRFPEKPILLAGGLDPSNVSSAMACVLPNGVDVASGVEESPGLKSSKLLKAFIDAAKKPIPY